MEATLLEQARQIIAKARAELGQDLCGFSVYDLLCDNLPAVHPRTIRGIMRELDEI
jgi:hypothetical protein